MKFLLVGVFVGFFVALPVYLLNTLVMPELNALQYTYAHAGQLADKAAGVPAR